MKTYVLTLSQVFPATHPRKGEPTYFKEQVLNAVFGKENNWYIKTSYPEKNRFKLHTIRENYTLWKKRFEQIERGEACLSVRRWSGRPYASEQVEIIQLTKKDGIGLQRLGFYYELHHPIVEGKSIDVNTIADNDGLLLKDWVDWFKNNDLTKPLAIIHFTKFRY